MSEWTERDTMVTHALALDGLAALIHARNVKAGWWKYTTPTIWDKLKEKTLGIRFVPKVIDRNMGELLCLVHSEISEAMEGHRKGLQDDKLPQYPMLIVELVDALIREFDILGRECDIAGVNLSDVFMAKLDFNATREDHKLENRMKPGGKAY